MVLAGGERRPLLEYQQACALHGTTEIGGQARRAEPAREHGLTVAV